MASLTVVADSRTSTASVGSPSVHLTVYPASRASTVSVGAPMAIRDVMPESRLSSVAVGVAVAAGPVSVLSRASTLVSGRAYAYRPADLRIRPSTASALGGAAIEVFGGQLNIEGASDDFTGAALGSSWALTLTGSGSLTPSTSGGLALDSGLTPGSQVRLEQTGFGLVEDFDAQAEFRLVSESNTSDSDALSILEFGLMVSGNVVTSMRLEQSRQRGTLLWLTTPSGGLNSARQGYAQADSRLTWRMLRAAGGLWVWVGGALVWATYASQTPGYPFVRVANASISASRVQGLLRSWVRRPVVRLAAQPLVDLQWLGLASALGRVPKAAPNSSSLLDVHVTGASGPSSVIPSGFAYVWPDDLIQGTDRGRVLRQVSDSTLRR